MVAALPIGAAVLAIGAVAALFVPGLQQMRAEAEINAAADAQPNNSTHTANAAVPNPGAIPA